MSKNYEIKDLSVDFPFLKRCRPTALCKKCMQNLSIDATQCIHLILTVLAKTGSILSILFKLLELSYFPLSVCKQI